METDQQISGFSLLQLSATESLLNSSQHAKVLFDNVSDKYDGSSDLHCSFYTLSHDLTVTPGDRIALFKIGWQQITDYELFEWAPNLLGNEKANVLFKAEYLPKHTHEFYQFCYVNADNVINGASTPFQFSIAETTSTDTVDNIISTNNEFQCVQEEFKPNNECDIIDRNACTECTSLRKQNEMLQSTIFNINTTMSKYDSQISDLRKSIENIKSLLSITQDDVFDFKTRLKTAGEEFKKIYLEKARTVKKYEKLVRKCQSKKNSDSSPSDFDNLDEFEPFPALPFPDDMQQI